jgi:hypothetical protein
MEIFSKLQVELQMEIFSKLQVKLQMEILIKLQVELQMDSLKNSERIKIKTKKKIKFKIRFKKIRMFQLMHHLELKILIKKNTKSLKKLRIKKIYSKFSILKKC